MNWIKQNTKLAVILGVMIAGGIGLGVWLYMAWSDYSAQMEEWSTLDKQTTTLENAKIYPSAANVKAFEDGLEDFRVKFLNLQQTLTSAGLQAEEKPMSEIEFQTKLKERSRLATAKAVKQQTKLPEPFGLSFEEYNSSLPVSPEAAAQLNVQLDVTEKFVNTLLDAGVKSIDTLERTRLALEKGGTPAPKPAPPKPANNNNKNKKGPALLVVAAPVLDRYTIKCTFTCDSAPLQNVMNNLADPKKTPQFLAVRQLHVENARQEAPTKEEVKSLLNKPGSDNASGGDTTTVTPAKTAPNAPRLVPEVKPGKVDAAEIMGGEDLKVYMEVDYIRFRKMGDEAAAPADAVSKK